MGKTAVVEAFRAAGGNGPAVWLAPGSAWNSTARGKRTCQSWRRWDSSRTSAGGDRLVTLLQQHAAHLAGADALALTAAHREQLRDELQG